MKKVLNDPVEVDLPIDKACYIIVKAREFDVKVPSSGLEGGSNATDDNMSAALESNADNSLAQELTSAINDLSGDERIDLVALMWLGRDDYTADDWQDLRQEAAREQEKSTANYLMGTPMFGDYIEEGLSILGHACTQYIIDRM